MTVPSQSQRLSVAVIVRDAAEPLRLTLASVRDLAFEIVVVDTGSTDDSRKVAREFGARVCDFAWTDDFSAARNHAISQTTGDWILWLDAGETLGDDAARDLTAWIASDAQPNTAYLCLIQIPPIDCQAEREQIARIRLMPNKPGLQFQGRVRESLLESLAASDVRIAAAPITIQRGEREHDTRVKKQRANRNIRLAEREQRETGFSSRLWNCLGESLQTLGEIDKGMQCYRQALSMATAGSPDQLEAYYGLLTSLEHLSNAPTDQGASSDPGKNHASAQDSQRHIRQTQITLCMRALEAFPLDAQLLSALAGYLHAQGHVQLALESYRTAYLFGQVVPTVWHVAEIREVAAVCYSVSLQLQDRNEEAIRFLEESLRDQGDSIKLRRRMIESYVNGRQRDAALSHVAALPKSFPKEALRSAVRGACYAVEKNWIAAKAYLQTAHGHGCREPLCLKWLSITLLANGELELARPILEQWHAQEPRNAEPAKLFERISASPAASGAEKQIRVDRPAPSFAGTAIPLTFATPSITSKK